MRADDPTPPEQIGIMLGLPATTERVAADILCTPTEHDYAWMFVRKQAGLEALHAVMRGDEDPLALADRAWRNEGSAPYRRTLERLLATAKRLDIKIANPNSPDRASLADLTLLSRQRRCVVVIAHWRGAAIQSQHWIRMREPEPVVERARQLASALLQIDGADPALAASLEAATATTDPLQGIQKALNQIIATPRLCLYAQTQEEAAFEAVIGSSVTIDDLNRSARNRDEIDRIFGANLLSSGNRLELGSGFVTPTDLDHCLGEVPGKTLFVACHSQVLQARLPIREHRRVWGRSDTLSPSGWLFALERALKQVATEGGDLMERLDNLMMEVSMSNKKRGFR